MVRLILIILRWSVVRCLRLANRRWLARRTKMLILRLVMVRAVIFRNCLRRMVNRHGVKACVKVLTKILRGWRFGCLWLKVVRGRRKVIRGVGRRKLWWRFWNTRRLRSWLRRLRTSRIRLTCLRSVRRRRTPLLRRVLRVCALTVRWSRIRRFYLLVRRRTVVLRRYRLWMGGRLACWGKLWWLPMLVLRSPLAASRFVRKRVTRLVLTVLRVSRKRRRMLSNPWCVFWLSVRRTMVLAVGVNRLGLRVRFLVW